MDAATVKSALIGVVKDIQISSGYDGSGVSGNVCPLKDLPGFDSMICVEAMSMLSSVLGIAIADDANIFVSENGKQLLTIDEAAAVVHEGLSGGET
jgi:acyl carrier protein